MNCELENDWHGKIKTTVNSHDLKQGTFEH